MSNLHTDTLEAYRTQSIAGQWVQIDRIASWGWGSTRAPLLTLRPEQARELAEQLIAAANAAHAADYEED